MSKESPEGNKIVKRMVSSGLAIFLLTLATYTVDSEVNYRENPNAGFAKGDRLTGHPQSYLFGLYGGLGLATLGVAAGIAESRRRIVRAAG